MNRDVANLAERIQRVEKLLAQAVPLLEKDHVVQTSDLGDPANACSSCGRVDWGGTSHHELDCPMRKLLELVKSFQG